MARNIIKYELSSDSENWIDFSQIINTNDTEISHNLCTEKGLSAVDEASVILRPNKAYLELRSSLVNLLLSDNTTKLYAKFTYYDEDGVIRPTSKRAFTGVVDKSKITIKSTKLPDVINVGFRDLSTLYLDEKIQVYIYLENAYVSEIVFRLLDLAGYTKHKGTINKEDDRILKVFTIDPDEGKTYRDIIDLLLLESCGYVLNIDAEGYANIVRIPYDYTAESGVRIVSGYVIREGLSTTKDIFDEDGLRVDWYTIAETDKNQVVYQDDVSRKIEDGQLLGEDIEDKGYFPVDGDIDPSYQEYSADFLDRDYLRGTNRKKNEDLGILAVRDVSSTLIAYDENGKLRNTGKDWAYPVLPSLGMKTNPTLYSKKAWYLLQNISGETLNIQHFTLRGRVIYKAKSQKTLVPAPTLDDEGNTTDYGSLNPREYEATYIYSNQDEVKYEPTEDGGLSEYTQKAHANQFARFYWHFLSTTQFISRWKENGNAELGEVVTVAHKATEFGQLSVVVSKTLTFIGSFIQSTLTAIGISSYNEYPVKNWGFSSGSSDRAVIESDEEFAVGDDYINAPADNWSSEFPAVDVKTQVVWKRTKTTYTDGLQQYGTPYPVSGVSGESAIIQYCWGSSGTQRPSVRKVMFMGKVIAWGNAAFVTDDHGWVSSHAPVAPEGFPYLWMRVSTDGGKTWVYSMISGRGIAKITKYYCVWHDAINPPDFSLFKDTPQTMTQEMPYHWSYEKVLFTDGSENNSTPAVIGTFGASVIDFFLTSDLATFKTSSRGLVTEEQIITFNVRKQNMSPDHPVIWDYYPKNNPKLVFADDGTEEKLKATITIKKDYAIKEVQVTAAIEGYDPKRLVILGIPSGDAKPIYLGKIDSSQAEPISTDIGPLVEGDSYMPTVSNDLSGDAKVTARIIRRYSYNASTGKTGWRDLETSDDNYSDIVAFAEADVFSNIEEDTVVSAQWGYLENVIAKNITARCIEALKIELKKGGLIRSLGYNKGDIDKLDKAGFYIDDEGYSEIQELVCKNGVFTNATITGTLDSQAADTVDKTAEYKGNINSITSDHAINQIANVNLSYSRSFFVQFKDSVYFYNKSTLYRFNGKDFYPIEFGANIVYIDANEQEDGLLVLIGGDYKTKKINISRDGVNFHEYSFTGETNASICQCAVIEKINWDATGGIPFISVYLYGNDGYTDIKEFLYRYDLGGASESRWSASFFINDNRYWKVLNKKHGTKQYFRAGIFADLFGLTSQAFIAENIGLDAATTSILDVQYPIDIIIHNSVTYVVNRTNVIYKYTDKDNYTTIADTTYPNIKYSSLFEKYGALYIAGYSDDKIIIAEITDDYFNYYLVIDSSLGLNLFSFCNNTFVGTKTGAYKGIMEIGYDISSIIDYYKTIKYSDDDPNYILYNKCDVVGSAYNALENNGIAYSVDKMRVQDNLIYFEAGAETRFIPRTEVFSTPWIFTLTKIKGNEPYLKVKDMIPEEDNKYDFGNELKRIRRVYSDVVNTSKLLALNLPSYSDDLEEGTVYKDSDGTLKVK